MSNRRDSYYPYHIHFDKLLDKDYYNPEFADCYHKHSEMAIIRTIYKEPFAFYLTEEDMKHYPENELKAIGLSEEGLTLENITSDWYLLKKVEQGMDLNLRPIR